MTEEIIAKLRSLDLSGGSHSRLSAIASCFYQPTFGWTRGACEALRDMLIETLEGKDGNDDNNNSDGCSRAHHRCDQHGRQVSYDELGNERRKAVCELRNMQMDTGNAIKKLAVALGLEWNPNNAPKSVALLQNRIIHLLGGDEPNLQKSPIFEDSGTNDAGEVTITDELRKFKGHINTGLTSEMVLALRAEVNCIADRIDAQFDRICEQNEAVLQATIDSMCEEQDRLQERLRTAELGCNANHRLSEANARWCDELVDLLRDAAWEYEDKHHWAQFWHNRAEDMRMERDELQSAIDEMTDELDSVRAKNRRLTWHIDQMQGGSRKWREKCEALKAERDELQAKLDEYDQTHVELPKDANGEYIHIGDRVEDNERVVRIVLTNGSWEPSAYIEKAPCLLEEHFCCDVSHYHEPTVEQVIRDLMLGKITEAQAIERIEGINGQG